MSEKIRSRSYWQGYADGFNGAWDAVDEMILLRQKGRPLTWKMARKLTVRRYHTNSSKGPEK